MPRPLSSTRRDWKPVSARISPELRDKLIKKHPNSGELSLLIQALLQKYADNKIFGVKIEVNS